MNSWRITIVWVVRELRVVPMVVGLASLLIANRLWEINRLAEDGYGQTFFLPSLWSWWMLAAGVASVAYACWFTSRVLLAISGALVVAGLMSRAVVVVFQLADGSTSLLEPQLHVAGSVYTLLSFLVALVWVRVMRPATSLLRRALDPPEPE